MATPASGVVGSGPPQRNVVKGLWPSLSTRGPAVRLLKCLGLADRGASNSPQGFKPSRRKYQP